MGNKKLYGVTPNRKDGVVQGQRCLVAQLCPTLWNPTDCKHSKFPCPSPSLSEVMRVINSVKQVKAIRDERTLS